jgi:aminoglycoside phosphotransferase (APT) family kinase protein
MEIREVGNDVISTIARQVFGPQASVEAAVEIRQTSQHAIPRIVGCNANLSYVVRMAGDPQRYVFRFSRGYREDRFEKESRNYALIAEKTDVPTPRVYAVDRTARIAPTPYMVLDWMPGDTWTFLSHSRNPMTNAEEKAGIERDAGGCYAQIHSIERKPQGTPQGTERMLYRLDQLRHVVQDGQFAVEMSKIDACQHVIETENSLLVDTESVCVADAELHFRKTDRGWQPSFICDMEWVDFGDPYFDLAGLCAPKLFWELDSLFVVEATQTVSSRPFFSGYEEKRHIDYGRLGRIASYAHFSCMCSIVGQVYRADKRAFMRSLEPKYVALIDGMLRIGGKG